MEEPIWWSKMMYQTSTKLSCARSTAQMDTAHTVWDANSFMIWVRQDQMPYHNNRLQLIPNSRAVWKQLLLFLFQKPQLMLIWRLRPKNSNLCPSKRYQRHLPTSRHLSLLQPLLVDLVTNRPPMDLLSRKSFTERFLFTASRSVSKNSRKRWRCSTRKWISQSKRWSLTHQTFSTWTYTPTLFQDFAASRKLPVISTQTLSLTRRSSSTVMPLLMSSTLMMSF